MQKKKEDLIDPNGRINNGKYMSIMQKSEKKIEGKIVRKLHLIDSQNK